MKQSDVSFALLLVLHAVSPPSTKATTTTGQNIKAASEMRAGSLTFTGTRDTKATARINTSLYKVAFLGMQPNKHFDLNNILFCSTQDHGGLFRRGARN